MYIKLFLIIVLPILILGIVTGVYELNRALDKLSGKAVWRR